MKLSFKYCRKCLKRYYTNPVFVSDQVIRFFIPTIDQMFNHYIVLVEITHATKASLSLSENKHNMVVDLQEIGKIIHYEQGTIDDLNRMEIIYDYYHNYHLNTFNMLEGLA